MIGKQKQKSVDSELLNTNCNRIIALLLKISKLSNEFREYQVGRIDAVRYEEIEQAITWSNERLDQAMQNRRAMLKNLELHPMIAGFGDSENAKKVRKELLAVQEHIARKSDVLTRLFATSNTSTTRVLEVLSEQQYTLSRTVRKELAKPHVCQLATT